MTLFAIISLVFVYPIPSHGQTTKSPDGDFSQAVQAGVSELAASQSSQTGQAQIKDSEYASTWDEFGMNVLVDGTKPAAEIRQAVTQDAIRTLQTGQMYDAQEAQYLESSNITPQEIQSLETKVGVDMPADTTINPNPSLLTNPDINISSPDGTGGPEAESSVVTGSTMDASSPAATSTAATTTDDTIFNAILQGETSQPSTGGSDASSGSAPTDTSGSSDVPGSVDAPSAPPPSSDAPAP